MHKDSKGNGEFGKLRVSVFNQWTSELVIYCFFD
jgi:hypothetical protein